MAIGNYSWEILESLEEKELELLKNTVSAPAGSLDQKILNVFEGEEPRFRKAKKTEFLKIFEDKKPQSLRVFHARFLKKLKNFLPKLAVEKHWWRHLFLLRELQKRKLHGAFMLNYHQIRKKLEQDPQRSYDYYRQKFELESIHQNQLLQFQTKPDNIPYDEAFEAFENWWIHQKLSLACFSKGQKRTRISSLDHDFLIKEILEVLEKDKRFADKPVLKIYKDLYHFLIEESGPTLSGIREQVIHNIALFSQEEKHSLFTLIYNQYVGKFNASRSEEDALALFRFFEWGMGARVMISEERISWDFYRNILELCILLKKFDKAESYLDDLYNNLTDKERIEIFPFFKGRLLYGKEEYGEALAFLNKRFDHPLLEVSARFLHIQALIEQTDWYPNEMQRILDSLARYIRKSKKLKNLALSEKYLKRCFYFRKMLKAKSLIKQEVLIRELKEEGSFSGKKWMLEKLKEGKFLT